MPACCIAALIRAIPNPSQTRVGRECSGWHEGSVHNTRYVSKYSYVLRPEDDGGGSGDGGGGTYAGGNHGLGKATTEKRLSCECTGA